MSQRSRGLTTGDSIRGRASGATTPRGVFPWNLAFLVLVATGALVFWSLAAVRIVRFRRLLGELRPAPAEVQSQVHKVARSWA